MIRVWLLCVLLCCSVFCRANDQPEIKSIRQKMLVAMNSKKTTDSLYESLNKLTDKSPIIIAYLGTLDALKAKHVWNPYSKIKALNQSEKLMQQAVGSDPHNMEIRFLRYSIQHNVPRFLGYGKNLDADKNEIITQLDLKKDFTVDKELTRAIIVFLLNSKRCSTQDVIKLNKYLAEIK